MNDPLIAWFVAVGGIVVAIILFLTAQAAQRRAERIARELAGAREQIDENKKKTESRAEQLRRRTEEVEELRRKLAKAKKRAAGAQKTQAEEGSRIAALQDESRAARDAAREAREESEKLQTEVQRLERELEVARRASAGPRSRPKERAETPAQTGGNDEAVGRLKEKLDAADEKNRSMAKRVTELEAELKKARGRAETNHRVYMVTKGELDVAKDRIRALEAQIADAPAGVKRRRRADEAAADAPAPESGAETPTGASAAESGGEDDSPRDASSSAPA